MKHRHLLVVILALQFCLARMSDATTWESYVTPANVGSQPLTLRIETESYDDGTIAFGVFVSSGKDKISSKREGFLAIDRNELPVNGNQHPHLLRPMVWCVVREEEAKGVLEYRFGVAREALSKARFEFRNYDPSGMPSMDVYVFRLGDFVAKK